MTLLNYVSKFKELTINFWFLHWIPNSIWCYNCCSRLGYWHTLQGNHVMLTNLSMFSSCKQCQWNWNADPHSTVTFVTQFERFTALSLHLWSITESRPAVSSHQLWMPAYTTSKKNKLSVLAQNTSCLQFKSLSVMKSPCRSEWSVGTLTGSTAGC